MPVVLPLVELGTLGIALLCIALALLIVDIMRHVGNVFRVVPVVGSHIAGAVESVAQSIANALGKAEGGIDAAIGASWHQLARFADELWALLKESASGYAALAEYVARLAYAHSGLRSLVHHADAAIHAVTSRVKTLEREWRGIEHRVGRLEHDLTRGIGHDLRIGLRDVEKELHGVEHGTIPALQHGLDAAEGRIASLGQFIGVKPGSSYLEWVKGIALAGLAALGLKGLACDNNPLKGKDCNSNVWGDLESVLGLAAAIGVAYSLTDVVGLLEELAPAAEGLLRKAA